MTQLKFTPFPWLPEPFHIDGLRHIILSCLPPGSELAWPGIFERDRPFLASHIRTIFEDERYGDADPLYTLRIERTLKRCSPLWHDWFRFAGKDNKGLEICRARIPTPVSPRYFRAAAAAEEGVEALRDVLDLQIRTLIKAHSETFWNIILSLQPLERAKNALNNIKHVLNVSPKLSDFSTPRTIHISLLMDVLGVEEKIIPRGDRQATHRGDGESLRAEIRAAEANAWKRGQWDVFEHLLPFLTWERVSELDLKYEGQNFEGLSLKTVVSSLNIDRPISDSLNVEMMKRYAWSNFLHTGKSFIRSFLRGGGLKECKELVCLIHPSKLERAEYKDLIVENGSAEIVEWYLPTLIADGWLPTPTSLVCYSSPGVLRLFLPLCGARVLLTEAISRCSEWAVRVALDGMERITVDEVSSLLTRDHGDIFIESRTTLCSSEGDPSGMIRLSSRAGYTEERCKAFWKKMADSGIRLTPAQHADMLYYGMSASREVARNFKYGKGTWWAGKVPEGDVQVEEKIPLTLYMRGNKGLRRSSYLHLACSHIPLEDLERKDAEAALCRSIKEEAWSDVSTISRLLKSEFFLLEEAVANGAEKDKIVEVLGRCQRLHSAGVIRGYLHYCGIWDQVANAVFRSA